MSHRLGKVDAEGLAGIIRQGEDSIFVVEGDPLDFAKRLPNTDFTSAIEIPPTLGSYSKDMVAAALASPASDFSGYFTRFVMFVYATGGKVTYKSQDKRSYEVTVTWPSA